MSSSSSNSEEQLRAACMPSMPRVVLRVGFIGHRRLREDTVEQIQAEIANCFALMSKAVVAVHPNHSKARKTPLVAGFYDQQQKPLVRLVTGLAEGADLLAVNALETTEANPTFHQHVEFERAGVIPFELEKYFESRDKDYRPTMLKLLKNPKFRYLTILDGIYEKPSPDTSLAKTRRRRGYRAQSNFLLRQSDVLVAVADPSLAEEKPGGTLEAIRNALSFHIPVILIRTENCYKVDTKSLAQGEPRISVRVFYPGEPFQFVAEGRRDSDDPKRLNGLIRSVVQSILADPDTENEDYGPQRLHSGHKKLSQYFQDQSIPPRRLLAADSKGPARLQRVPTFRERVWGRSEQHFRRPVAQKITEHRDAFLRSANIETTSEDSLDTAALQNDCLKASPFKKYRDRATELNYHFSGLYRGTYLLNFTLAVIAVALASVSLACLAIENLPSWTKWLLVVFAVTKFGILLWIGVTTHRANHAQYSQLAVDFRYLAERLLAMQFLPAVGSFQPPQPRDALDAQRMARQSSAEWLFQAIVRSISPERFAQPIKFMLKHDGSPEAITLNVVQPEPALSGAFIRQYWIEEQIHYHQQSSLRHRAMADAMRSGASKWSGLVIAAVSVDVVLATTEAFHLIPQGWTSAAVKCSVFLMVVAGLVPAAVAAMNGIRVQSECERLTDRHHFVRLILGGRFADSSGNVTLGGYWLSMSGLIRKIQDKASDTGNFGTWSGEVLELTEELATDMVREVSEWSVVYDREVMEP